MRRGMVWPVALLAFALPCLSQSLGDIARRERARKDQNSTVQRHVYTNEDLSAKSAVSPETGVEPKDVGSQPGADDTKRPSAAELRASILGQKQTIRDLETRATAIQHRLDEWEQTPRGVKELGPRALLGGSGMGSPGPGLCAMSDALSYSPYKEWCAEPAKLKGEMEKVQAELKQARTGLHDMQEKARRMGYRSAIYDPD